MATIEKVDVANVDTITKKRDERTVNQTRDTPSITTTVTLREGLVQRDSVYDNLSN